MRTVERRSAEQVLREYIDFDDVNGSETVEMLPLTIVDAMGEFAGQFQGNFCPFCGKEKEYIRTTDINSGRVCMNKLCKGE